jgi:alkylation response protein AidB-like acyl-CoA dehydrogenase
MPVIRRLGERGRGATEPISEADAATREAVWQSLAALGALRSATGEGTPPLRETVVHAELMGRATYQSPYFDTLTAAELFATEAPDRPDAPPDDLSAELSAAIAAGDITIAIAARADGADDLRRPAPIEVEPDTGRITGERRFVAFAADVDFVCVVGRTAAAPDAELTAALVPVDQPGVTIRRHDDIGRGELYQITFDHAEILAIGPSAVGATGPARGWAAAWAAALARARLRHASYLVGLTLGAVDLTADYARHRMVFGQPLAQFQAPAFRLAQLASRAEAVRTMLRQAAADADAGAGADADGTAGIGADTDTDTALTACQALLLAGDLALEAGAEAVQLHGSFGLTMPCDAQRFYRRAVVDAILLGTGRDLRRHALELLTTGGKS